MGGAQAYCDAIFVTALALAVARRWPNVISHAVDPGWVPTRMGGLRQRRPRTRPPHPNLARRQRQSDATRSGKSGTTTDQPPSPPQPRQQLQDRLLMQLAEVTGIDLEGQYGARGRPSQSQPMEDK
jgi:hypothetical protein